jgi:uncharacterized protein (DUF697 family)
MSNEIAVQKQTDLAEKRKKAESWVNGYTATAIGLVIATAIIPGAGTVALVSIEGIMCYQIGKIYNHEFTEADGAAVASTIGLAAFVGPIAAFEASLLLGPFAFAAKPAIAAGIVKSMGQLVIKHFEHLNS